MKKSYGDLDDKEDDVSAPAKLDFTVQTDNNKPSIPTGFSWEVVHGQK